MPARGSELGRRWWPVVVVAVLAGGSLAGCSTSGQRSAGTDRTTTTEADGSTGPPATSGPGTGDPDAGPDPEVDDISDPVFDGLGDPRIDVSHYDVRVKADPGAAALAGTVAITLAATTAEPLPSFTLDLRGPEVSKATVDGEPAEVTAGEAGEIVVTPAEPLAPGADAEAVLTYAGEAAQETFPGLGVPVGWQADDEGGWFTMSEPNGTATWVPVNDHPSDKATWTVSLDTPGDAVGVSNGRLVSRDRSGGRRLWVWETDQPMASYLVLAMVGDYDLVERAGPAGSKVVFAFPASLPAADRKSFDALDDIIGFYSETFGDYADDDLGAVVAPTSLGLALETQTRPLFGLDATGEDDVWALAHELGHQWFGDAVSPASWGDLWLNESFATYADWLYREHVGEGSIEDLADDEGGNGGEAVLDPEAAGTFSAAVYGGGARALQGLRMTVGDDDFFEILRTWFADHQGESATTDDFTALAEEVSGRDLDQFFDDWLRSKNQPDLPG